MKEIRIFDCDDRPMVRTATGTYFGNPPKPEKLRVGDIAELLCNGVTVLVTVTSINDRGIVGTLFGFENFDGDSINGFTEGDEIQFDLQKVLGWQSGT